MNILKMIASITCLVLATGTDLFAKEPVSLQFQPQSVYRFSQKDRDKLYVSEGYPGQLTFLPTSKLKDANTADLTVEVPDGIQVTAFGWRSAHAPTPALQYSSELFQKDGKTYRRYKIKPYLDALKEQRPHRLYFQAQDGLKRFDGTTIGMTLSVNGEIVAKNHFQLVNVPLPKTELPKDFRIFLYFARLFEVPDKSLFCSFFDLQNKLGVQGILVPAYSNEGLGWQYDFYRKANWKLFGGVGGTWDMKQLNLPRTDDSRPRCSDGSTPETRDQNPWQQCCPEVLIDTFRKHKGFYRKLCDARKRDGIYLDMEDYTIRLQSICFCPRCVKKFLRQNNLPETLTPREIETKYASAWENFREKQRAEVVQAFFEVYTDRRPGVQSVFCSFYENEKDNSFALIRNKYYDSFSDYIMPMTYYRGAELFDIIRYNAASTSKPFWPMIYTNDSGNTLQDWNTPEELELNILLSAACGSSGVAFYAGPELDGKYHFHILRAMENIRKGERFFDVKKRADHLVKIINNSPASQMIVDGQKIPVSKVSLNSLRSITGKDGRELLVTLLNSAQSASAKAKVIFPSLPEGLYSVTNLQTDAVYCKNHGIKHLWTATELKQGIPVELSAWSYLQLLVRPGEAAPPSSEKMIMTPDAEQQMEPELVEPPLSRNSMSVTRTDPEKKQRYLVKVSTPSQEVWIDPADSARLTVWKTADPAVEVVLPSTLGMVKEMFDQPQVTRLPEEWTVADRKIDNDSVTIVLTCSFAKGPLSDFSFRKTYTVYRNAPRIGVHCRIEVKRPEKKNADFRIRIQNQPSLGIPLKQTQAELAIVSEVNGKECAFAGTENIAFGSPTGMFAGYLKKTLKGPLSSNGFSLRRPDGLRLAVSFENPKLVAQVFSWRRSIPPTMEWFYQPTDFPSDPHVGKVWEASFELEIRK